MDDLNEHLSVLKAVLRLLDNATFKDVTTASARQIAVIRDAFAELVVAQEQAAAEEKTNE